MNDEYSLLLVEDDAELLEILARRLTRNGFRVTACQSAAAALQAAKVKSFDVALIDRILVREDGLMLGQRLTAMQPLLRFVVLSGLADPESRTDAERFGAFDYLTKPCSLSDLEASIRRACQATAAPSCSAAIETGALG